MAGIDIAMMYVALILAIYLAATYRSSEGMEASPEAHRLSANANILFDSNPDATFGDFKKQVGGDAVQYTDLRALHRSSALTPLTAEPLV